MATIRFTRDFSAVFSLLSLLGANNMVKMETIDPDGTDETTDHWTQIRDLYYVQRDCRVVSLTVLEECIDMAEIYAAGNHLGPIEIEDLEDEQAHEDQLSNLLAINVSTCVKHKEFVGPVEPTEQMLMRLDLPF